MLILMRRLCQQKLRMNHRWHAGRIIYHPAIKNDPSAILARCFSRRPSRDDLCAGKLRKRALLGVSGNRDNLPGQSGRLGDCEGSCL